MPRWARHLNFFRAPTSIHNIVCGQANSPTAMVLRTRTVMVDLPVSPIVTGIREAGGTDVNELDQRMMRKAFDVARAAASHGNRPFGALLVDGEGQILFSGENTVADDGDVTGHAETHVVRQATRVLDPEALAGCTMYASTEPCPMCSAAIFMANIRRVVFGISAARLRAERGDANAPSLQLSCADVMARASHPIEVIGPFLEDEAVAVHRGA